MLQKIDSLSWDVGDDYTVDYAPSTLHVEDLNHWRFYEIDLPPGVVLAQEVDAPADPFMPDAEVRAALRNLFGNGSNTPDEYFERRVVVRAWVRSWPDEA